MVRPNIQCTNPACDENNNDGNNAHMQTTETVKCRLVEKCASSCAAYGKICPCAARAAGRAACSAVEKLYRDSCVFTKKPDFVHLDNEDLIIQKKLGEGGFSLVHKVTLKTDIKKKYAIKYLKRRIMVDQHSFELGAADLAVEANFLATLNHPHIVKLHGITAGSVETNVASGKECGFFILIDLLPETVESKIEEWKLHQEHGTLLTRLSHDFKERKRAALLERLKIATEIADAMMYLHSLNIVYRDLKPDNIGFDSQGCVKLFDFGLAKELRKKHLDGSYKLTGNTGSRRYMAPEVAKEQHYDLSVDVYSFGILLNEMITLEKPFLGYSATKHMMQVVMGGERPKIDTHGPVELQWLLKRCWSKNAKERPTFAAIKTCLVEISGGLHMMMKSPKRIPRLKSSSSDKETSKGGSPDQSPRNVKEVDADQLPDFKSMKPTAKPTRESKSLGFLRRS